MTTPVNGRRYRILRHGGNTVEVTVFAVETDAYWSATGLDAATGEAYLLISSRDTILADVTPPPAAEHHSVPWGHITSALLGGIVTLIIQILIRSAS